MGVGERQYLMKRLQDMEQTIVLLHQRVSRLQREVDCGRVRQSPGFLKGSCLRALFAGWGQGERGAGIVRQNRRVERHAAALF
jgi:hypothetical protein